MQGCFLAIVGLVLGAMLGAMFGVGLGFAYTKIFNVSDFEGYREPRTMTILSLARPPLRRDDHFHC
jgi:NhaP-type Na+/H+ or K+/H+ antiporter